MRLPPLSGKRILTVALILLGAVLLLPKPAAAITPDDKRVKDCVKKALSALSKFQDARLGGECLIGLCFYKAGEPVDHPKIQRALKACRDVNFNSSATGINDCDNYSLGIGLMFLCEIDLQNQDLIEKFSTELFKRQKTMGAWGYANSPTGDTSQTQYAVLGMWMVKDATKIEVPIDRIEGVGGWLMRTQDPSGGWGYQGVDPGSLVKVSQTPLTPTLAASAAGSMYMVADMLRVTKRVDVALAQKSKALQDVAESGKKGPSGGSLTETLNPDDIKSTLAAADRALGNGFKEQPQWNHYYMYALERYHSFREKAGGAKDNLWYDQGVAYLEKTQQGDGSWASTSDSAGIATCFATLFLLRSSEKAIVKREKLLMGDGLLAAGGIRLPKDVKTIQSENGKVVDRKIVVSTDQILDLVNKGESEDVTRLAEKREALELSSNKSDRDRQIEKLRKFVGAGDYNARLVAVMTLGKNRDLDNVPRLLYALTDKEPQIVLQADRGLRFISRKVSGVGLPEADPTEIQIKAAQAAWKAWYISIRPNAELLD